MNFTGTIQVFSFTADDTSTVPFTEISLMSSDNSYVYNYLTDENGYSEPVVVSTVSRELSLRENNIIQPYSTYNLVAKAEGYEKISVFGIQVFEGENSVINLSMIPSNSERSMGAIEEKIEIPRHLLFSTDNMQMSKSPKMNCPGRILSEVVIPEKITVHLGKPSASAANVTVSFKDYIKNVASSEIYPTWPEQSLRANIYCQISIALNRIFTEWYLSKGYNFQITNSTSYDQYYVKGRNIFENISILVDEIFNTYIIKSGNIDPYYAEYCDGKTVSCKGLKQWGTVDLAQSGRNALSILRYYYGNDVELVTSQNIKNIPQSYPGTPLRVGSSGTNVKIIQRQLNRIARDYPLFGTENVSGEFTNTTSERVKKFQKQFSLSQDGVVGKGTWYEISYIYVSVKKLAQLTSEGEKPTGDFANGVYPGTALKQGSLGIEVEQMQYYLSKVGEFVPSIPNVTVDGLFGSGTKLAVIAFQRWANLTPDGIVGKTTWDRLYKEYVSIENDSNNGLSPGEYPGRTFRQGDSGDVVKKLQFWLRVLANNYSSIPKIAVDGSFGAGTTNCVKAFQEYFKLTADGVVGKITWDKIYEVYTDVINKLLPQNQRPGTYPGTALRLGSSGAYVKEMQYYLFLLSAYYTSIPQISYDGIFGQGTFNAVKAYQRIFDLTADGIVGSVTWNSIYSAISRLRTVDGPVFAYNIIEYPGRDIILEDMGEAVEFIQINLNIISYYYDCIMPIPIDGYYSFMTESSVMDFQMEFNLPITGVVDKATWDLLYRVFTIALSTMNDSNVKTGEYPDYVMTIGSMGEKVKELQSYMNVIASQYCTELFVKENGIFDEEMQYAVIKFQEGFYLTVTGFVDRATWDAIYEYYAL